MMENDSPTAATKVSSSFKKKQWAVALDVTMSKTASMSSLDGAVFASGGDKKQQHTSITSNTVPHEVWVLHILKKNTRIHAVQAVGDPTINPLQSHVMRPWPS